MTNATLSVDASATYQGQAGSKSVRNAARVISTPETAEPEDGTLPRASAATKKGASRDSFSIAKGAIRLVVAKERLNVIIERQDQPAKASSLLYALYALCKEGKRREAIDAALDYFDDLLIDGQFAACDQTLAWVDAGRLSSSAMVSILGVTLRAKNRLREREPFFLRARKQVAALSGKKYANELLNKYR